MVQQLAYNVIESLANHNIYLDITIKSKTLIFLKNGDYTWELHYAGWHILNIETDIIEFVWNGVDSYTADDVFDLLKNLVISHISKDEAYQIITSIDDLSFPREY